ncbi:MAG: hypothetical protein IKA00_07995 [Prevotella sp.]|nr:hypothetical protein [Prevotella sp.]
MKRFPKHNNNESNNYICYTTSSYFDDIDKQISEKTITYKRFKRNKTDELPKTKKKCKIRHKQAKPKNQVIPDKLKILEQKASRHKRYTENPGFSSTGVPLPTDEAKLEFAASKKRRRDNSIRNIAERTNLIEEVNFILIFAQADRTKSINEC